MFTVLVKYLFCSAAKGSLSIFFPILFLESFYFKKTVYNGLGLESYTLYDFQLGT